MRVAALLLAGILLPQIVLYYPSLTGRKLLLPLEILAVPGNYLPPEIAQGVPVRTTVLSDLVFQMEPLRQFAASEVRAGRLPLWNPYTYCGSPFLANNQSAVFSPYRLVDYLFPSPVTLAYTQLLQSLVAGFGAYLFFRRALRVAIAPALIGAWCYPLTGALVFWTGYTIGATMTFLPLVLYFTDRTIHRPGSLAPIGLALATAASLLAGHSATAAHIVIAACLFAIFRLLLPLPGTERGLGRGAGMRSAASFSGSLILSFLLAAPQLFPTLEYLQSSYRFNARLAGENPTAVLGFKTFAQIILPYSYGTDERTSWQFFPYNIPESAASGYAGLLLILAFAPLAFAARRHRATAVFFLLLALVAAISILGIPLLANLFDSFPLSALRNNRFVFVTGFALLALAVMGLDAVWRRPPKLKGWTYASFLLLVAVASWCLVRVVVPFKDLRIILSDAAQRLAAGEQLAAPFHEPHSIERLRLAFATTYFTGFAFAAAGIVILLMLASRKSQPRPRLFWIVAGIALLELLITAWGRVPQSDPALYYPPLGFTRVIHNGTPGRTLPVRCLPSNLNMPLRLPDVRGYDATDPQRMIELLNLARQGDAGRTAKYANLQYYAPRYPSPILDMLAVRYLVGPTFREPLAPPIYSDSAYWIVENTRALPRAYVPRSARIVNDKSERLKLLAEEKFNPRDVAYVEATSEKFTELPPGPYEGIVRIESELPTRLTLSAEMKTPGVVILSDLYDKGWRATINGAATQILPANHAVRGLIVPAGASKIELRYEPGSFTWGMRLAAIAALGLIVRAAFVFRGRRAVLRMQ